VNRLDDALSFHQTALRIRAQRQELLAANIANADTPNYKARDLDFSSAMSQAMAETNTTNPKLALSQSAQLNLTGPNQNSNKTESAALYRRVTQGSVDGNTVDMDVERNQFVDNSLRYEASLTLINAQLKKMLSAIQGQ
jgi:flagellar basal-body rod protein FlgB